MRYENNREIRVKVQRKAGGLVARLRVEDNRFYKIQNTQYKIYTQNTKYKIGAQNIKYVHRMQNMYTEFKICTQNTKYVNKIQKI